MTVLTKLLDIACVAPEEGACGMLTGKQNPARDGAHSLPPSQDICHRRDTLLSFARRQQKEVPARYQRSSMSMHQVNSRAKVLPSSVVFEDPDGPICTPDMCFYICVTTMSTSNMPDMDAPTSVVHVHMNTKIINISSTNIVLDKGETRERSTPGQTSGQGA